MTPGAGMSELRAALDLDAIRARLSREETSPGSIGRAALVRDFRAVLDAFHVPLASPDTAPPEEELDYASTWRAFEEYEAKAAKNGSGMIREQMTGAAMMLGWLVNRAALARPAPLDDRLERCENCNRMRQP